MDLKESVDKYIGRHFKTITKLKGQKGFKWSVVALRMKKEDPTVDKKSDKELGEYIRGRFRVFQDKVLEEVVERTNISTTGNQPFCLQFKENRDKGTAELTDKVSKKLDDKEIYEKYNVDPNKYKISQVWYKDSSSGYNMSVLFTTIKTEEETVDNTIKLKEEFIQKLNSIKPFDLLPPIKFLDNEAKPSGYFVITKQDAHWNKHDISGNNSIEERFATFTKTLLNQLEKAVATNKLEKIVYVIGSDEFNSEWTGMTTKGTPQQNILSYQDSFEKITNFNIETIKFLCFYAEKIEVILLNGNHDENVSWHLLHILKTVFKKSDKILFNDSLENTKVIKLAQNLILMNHGDVIKPKDLAAKFPIIARNQWSECSNYFVLCGDKHHEVAHDYNGIMFYQVPQLSKAKSKWDEKMGYTTSKPELLTFLFEEEGLATIFRKEIK